MVLADDPDGRIQAALDLWSAFPVDADPRPLIFSVPPVHVTTVTAASIRAALISPYRPNLERT
jgi:hypothetical protein